MIDREILKRYSIVPRAFERKKNAVFVKTKDEEMVLKKRNKEQDKIFDYLRTRNFNYFPGSYHFDDSYDIFEYLEDYDISNEERSYDLINLVSLLHLKTTHYRNVDIDDYKVIYEDISSTIDDLFDYYGALNDEIDNEIYMSPASYLLARNITEVYSVLNFCKNELEDWYDLVKDTDKKRVTLVHNNLELDHLIRNEGSYLISWDHAKFDFPIYDLERFYRKNYKEIHFDILLNSYEKKYPLTEDERKLLFILISIPDKIALGNHSYSNMKVVDELLSYLYKTNEIISPYYAKQQEYEEYNFSK